MKAKPARIGLIGFGGIGRGLYDELRAKPGLGLEVAFVHTRRPVDVAPDLALPDLARIAERRPDLVVEVAHPGYTRQWGERILETADYLPLSVSAFCDEGLLEKLTSRAAKSGRRLFIPHGALIGMDNLLVWRHMWKSVRIKFIKSPASIDFSESGFDPATIRGETVVYDGPVRGIGRLYPRNVNTMVTCALATVGLDRCHATLVAVPGLQAGVIEIEAVGKDGARLSLRKEQPMTGVSGTEMFASLLKSVRDAAGAGETLSFV
jgi:predicted dinucleotide-utilizing enzyme